ncbi:MAG: phage tail sheath subtilisin-like domain-containing protein [Candidatus Rokuibacteriota bacterium]
MPEYLHPGVYVEEVSSGVRPIEGVGTSTAGFIGVTAKGVPNKATFVTSWTQFVNRFGGFISQSYLPYAVAQFFDNGGKKCYVVRVLSDASALTAGIDLPDQETNNPRRNTLRIRAKGAGGWGNDLTVAVQDATQDPTRQFTLVVHHEGQPVELFDGLSMDSSAQTYVETEINGVSNFIEVEDLNAQRVLAQARRTTTNALAAAVNFGAGQTLIIEMPDGTTSTVTLTGAAVPRADVVTAINAAWAALNVTASLSAAPDPADRLVITHNAPGFDRYFALSGTATGAGQPLDGLAGFAQGSGDAIGGTLKSVAAATFAIAGAPANELAFTVNGDAVPPVGLTVGNRTAAEIAAELNTAFQASQRILVASTEGNRVVVATANAGAANATVAAAGGADAVLQFRNVQRTAANATGQGRSEPAFVQSAPGPFTLSDNSNFSLAVNNGGLGAPSAPIVVNFTAAAIPNLQEVSAQTVAATINGVAGGAVTASVVNNTVVIRQSRRGPYHRLRLTDGLGSPNIRLKFETAEQTGFADGDKASPYFRPGFNFDASQVNRPWPLAGGDDGSPVSNFDYIGTADRKTGLHALDDVIDVNFITIPGNSDAGVIGRAVGYCTVRKDCVFIADAPGKRTRDTPTTEPAEVQDFLRNQITTKTSYGALYYPWLEIPDPVGAGKNPRRFVPPSGFVAGLYARIDGTRGVWKAPAGTEATVIGALGPEYAVTDSEQDILNPYGVNCVRQFPGPGLVVWGARTMGTQSDPEYRYIPVRRYAIYLEQSIYHGTQYAVFEPNDFPLWDSLKANIEDFMMGEFRKGALAGRTPEEAFEVRCDADLNPPSEVNAGRVNMEVKFAPLKPAEFVIIRISQKTQRPQG